MRRGCFLLAGLLVLVTASLGWAGGLDFANAGMEAQKHRKFDEAIEQYTKAIEAGDLSPTNMALAYNNRGNCWRFKGKFANSIADYRKGIEADPKHHGPYNSLAWVLATCPQDQFRNGGEAVKLAQKAASLADPTMKPACLDTLAAAQAETGNFDEAVKTQKEAIGLLKKQRAPKSLLKELDARLKLYQANKPWRDK